MARRQSETAKWMGPMLDVLRELGGSGKTRQVVDAIAERMGISDDDERLQEQLKSGQTRFYNQVCWARQNLVLEGLLKDTSSQGVWELTPKGYETTLDETEARKIVLKWVKIHAERRKEREEESETPSTHVETEDEDQDHVVEDEDQNFDLLRILKSFTGTAFEQICRRLLLESGFEKVTLTPPSRDKGIDGIGVLQVNAFVSMKVVFQCKCYTTKAVSRADIAAFRGDMAGVAEKGLFITTSRFTKDARDEAEKAGADPVELVDGEKLVQMFQAVELGVKVKLKKVYEVDHAFFAPWEKQEPARARTAKD